MNEIEFIRSISDGDRNSFSKLYREYSPKIYNTALVYCQNVEDSEEVTQDVFTNIHKNASKFKGDSSLSTWIYRITVNTSLNLIKKRKRFFTLFTSLNIEAAEKPTFEHPGVILENKERASELFMAIDRLPENQKTAFILSHIEGLPRQEVADIMEVSLKAIESLLQRAKVNLRKTLNHLKPTRRKL